MLKYGGAIVSPPIDPFIGQHPRPSISKQPAEIDLAVYSWRSARVLARSRSGQARGCKRKIAVAANECSMPSSLPELTVPALPAFPLSLLSISPVHHAAPRGNFQMTRFRRSLCANERGCETSRKDQGNYTEGILDCVGPGRKNVLQQEFGADERQEQREREP